MRGRSQRLSRRSFLLRAATTGAAALLTACGSGSGITPPAATNITGDPASVPAPTAATAATTAPTAPAADQTQSFESRIDTAGIKKGGTIIEGSTADVRTLNPILVSDVPSGRIMNLVFDSLVKIHPDTLEPVPNLAAKWEVSDDNKTYTFTIKEGVTWHDGEPFTSADVKFTYDLLMNPATGTPRAGTLNQKVASVEATDPATVVITLKNVDASFVVNDLDNGIVPRHLLEDVAPADLPTSEFTTSKPVGTGPFRFKEFLSGDRVTLEANPDYHGGAPAIDTYIRKFVKDPTALYQQLKTGEVDFAGFDSSFYGDAQAQTNFTTFAYDTFSFTFFGYNLDDTKGTSIFQDVQVRQALFYAIDRPGIIESVRGGLSTLARGTMPVLSWAYQPDKIELTYDYDPARAEQMLDEAGWVKGDDGIRVKDGERLAFTLHAQSGSKTADGFVAVFQENLRTVGVEITPQQEEFSLFVERLTKTFDFDAFIISFSWDPDPDQAAMWSTDSYPAGFNLFKYSNPEVDELLEQGSQTLDQEERKRIYADMQNLVLADAPALVTDFPKALGGVSTRVRNLIPNAVSTTFNSNQWYVSDGR